MGGGAVLLVRRAVADMAVDDDERRLIGCLEAFQRLVEGGGVVGVVDMVGAPAISLEALGDIVAEGQVGRALDGDSVAVIDPAEIAKLQMAGQRGARSSSAITLERPAWSDTRTLR